MNLEKKRIVLTVCILLAVAGLFSGIFVSQHLHQSKKVNVAEFHGTYLEHPRPINSFNLMGTDQKSFDNESLKGQWTMIFFGFTNCGYLCPTTMAELGKMHRILEEEGVKLPHVVMISIDPDRDSLDKLGSYVTAFNPAFYGARGSDETIKSMTREMGIAYGIVASKDSTDPQNYDVQHSGAVMLFNPKGELSAFFTTPHHAELLAKDYITLVS